jgi:hypothetical protein
VFNHTGFFCALSVLCGGTASFDFHPETAQPRLAQ